MSKQCNACANLASFECGNCKNAYYCGTTCQLNDYKTHGQVCGSQIMLIQGKRMREGQNNVAAAMTGILDQTDVSFLMFETYFSGSKASVYALLSLEENSLPFFAFYDDFRNLLANKHFSKSIHRPQYNITMGPDIYPENDFSRFIEYLPDKKDAEPIWEYMTRRKDVLL